MRRQITRDDTMIVKLAKMVRDLKPSVGAEAAIDLVMDHHVEAAQRAMRSPTFGSARPTARRMLQAQAIVDMGGVS